MDDKALRVLYLLLLLMVVGSGVMLRRRPGKTSLKYGLFWLGIILALMVFYQTMRGI